MPFYEVLRDALTAYEAFVHEVKAPASLQDRQQAEARMGTALPRAYANFLASFNGVLLFHESICLFSCQDQNLVPVTPQHIRIGEMALGSLWMNQAGMIFLVDEDQKDPILLASDLEHFLESTLAREGLLYDRYGEFLEVFDEEGELLPEIHQKQIKLGRKKDPKSAFYLMEEAEWMLNEHQIEKAIALLVKAILVDPSAGPCLELLASLHQEQNHPEEAVPFLIEAAQAALDLHLKASRFLQAAELLSSIAPTHSSSKNMEGDRKEKPLQEQIHYLHQAWQVAPDYAQFVLQQIEELLPVEPQEAQTRYQSLQLLLAFVPEPYQNQAKAIQEQLKPLESKLRVRSALKVL